MQWEKSWAGKSRKRSGWKNLLSFQEFWGALGWALHPIPFHEIPSKIHVSQKKFLLFLGILQCKKKSRAGKGDFFFLFFFPGNLWKRGIKKYNKSSLLGKKFPKDGDGNSSLSSVFGIRKTSAGEEFFPLKAARDPIPTFPSSGKGGFSLWIRSCGSFPLDAAGSSGCVHSTTGEGTEQKLGKNLGILPSNPSSCSQTIPADPESNPNRIHSVWN